MTYPTQSYAAFSPTTPLASHSFERRELRADDVLIDIMYCGVCHSDLHTARNDWGFTHTYPIVVGHEIIGRIAKVGDNAHKFKVGDLVGVGCMVDSCRTCSPCSHGLEQYCEHGNTGTYGSLDRHDGTLTQGGYSTSIVVSEDFVLKVSENLDTQAVAPLLCAGITTYSPLRYWKVGKGTKVGVVGLGGLGHMAVKLAHAMGADVTLFTRSLGKSDDAYHLGASRVVLSTDENQMKEVASTFDVIIDTVPYTHDLKPYVPTLALDGTLVLVGLVGELEQTINTVPMIMGRRSISASVIGGIAETQEMLDFCAEHNIVPDVEMINMQDINTAYERMQKSDVKYRFVIDMGSLRG
ncbi:MULTISPECIES: NAD(P)-dependent alcohol dehydrogenase [Moraxella]|uniref:Hydroxyacid dehydrogenase n=1 Tax=Moraxella lacunata TaxID=477 RepID=A0A1B8PVG8_MORLA|nr:MULTISPECIES: NAD(P)-dependent alcohol dehydrogenase [Moraxella]MBE9579404.1 NAD(P)-dependent alcohol dehydrogenase [Moraxella sp. K1664]MBE9588751.1 NAD(P)-dependent alcohol dehydrogenase [Moraxella sp. K1630]MBE9596962.1 NAD(P)-dependent alcohol dehydrogenase [Moraxella sp. K2450]MDH9219534.1 NAD(P)-dependent alcohol dehydrogenase [Moraxella lacunata]MDI4483503.1 NAD(P)-dependent alcohol dehydrogenase [Moraxella lacunata]